MLCFENWVWRRYRLLSSCPLFHRPKSSLSELNLHVTHQEHRKGFLDSKVCVAGMFRETRNAQNTQKEALHTNNSESGEKVYYSKLSVRQLNTRISNSLSAVPAISTIAVGTWEVSVLRLQCVAQSSSSIVYVSGSVLAYELVLLDMPVASKYWTIWNTL